MSYNFVKSLASGFSNSHGTSLVTYFIAGGSDL